MKRLVLILLLCIAGQAQGTIALVTGNILYTSATVTTLTSGAIAVTPNMSAGQYLVVSVATGNSAQVAGTNLELIATANYIGATSCVQAFFLFRATGTVSSFTVTTAGSALGLSVVASVFSSTNRLRIDTSAFATATSASIASGVPATTASTDELWIGVATLRGVASATFSSPVINGVAATASYSISTNIGTAASERACAQWYRIVSGTASPTATITGSASGVYTAGVVCLEETPSTAAGEVSYGFSQ